VSARPEQEAPFAARPDDEVRILLVDDRTESLLAIEAALKSLGPRIIKAESGQEALRHLLRQDFALILLDVNMPRMDGFETAALIRARRRSAHTPIIFITAYADDLHISRGYKLGAVDYILSPVVPDVLRSKVTVFVDLYRKNAQITRQAVMLGNRAARERRLTDASLAIHSSGSIDELLSIAATTAAELVEGRLARATSISEIRGRARRSAARIMGESGARTLQGDADRCHSLAATVMEHNQMIRASQAALPLEPDDLSRGAQERHAKGWLGVPLRRRDGSNMGLIEVAGRMSGDFDDEDQAVLMQLAHMTSIAVENCLLAEEREANQLKDEFLATLSHELRTPLNSILGWVHLLSSVDAAEAPDIAEGLAVIERSVRAQNRLIEDLLDVSRISRGDVRLERQPVDLDKVLRSAIDSARPAAAEKGLEMELGSNGGRAWMLGDADRVQQIVGNLLSNAIKFTPRGGTVCAGVSVTDGKALITVSDDGEGIAAEFLPRVFQRFQQADHGNTRRFSGLGIGLTIVKHLVEAHGGTIRLHSGGRGLGTTATVEFALLAEAERDTAVAEAEAPEIEVSSDLAGLRVLLVDDQEDARDVASRILRRSGAEVVGAGSAAEALSLIGRTQPDLLISDLAMPGESGFSLIARVRKLPPPIGETPAIALSALVGPHDCAEALSAGFQVHTAKPCDPRHLVSLAASLTADGRRHVRRRETRDNVTQTSAAASSTADSTR
jgi:signal transduction histidine kinase/DNA-binding response OmpR family regulator